MRVEPGTRRADGVLAVAAREATAHGAVAIGTAHVLVGLCADRDGVAGRTLAALGFGLIESRGGLVAVDDAAEWTAPGLDGRALATLGVDLEAVRRRAEAVFGAGALDQAGRDERYTPRLRRVLDHARVEALALGHAFIGTEHLLLGILDEPDGGAARLLRAHGVNLAHARAAVLAALQAVTPTRTRFWRRGTPRRQA